MNDRKRAWQILHTEIRRRVTGTPDDDTWTTNVAAILAEIESVSRFTLQLAGFGAAFALKPATHNGPLDVADEIGASIMAEPDS